MITKYGYDVVATVIAGVAFASLFVWFFVDMVWLKFGFLGLLALLMLFTISFFRDPERITPEGPGLVIAPADGRVIGVKEVVEEEYLKGGGMQVSIFMSPLNVHVNRYPVSGRVGYFRHIPGEFLVAFDDKSSARNERTHIGVENEKGKVLFKQIAGFVARRIIAPVQVGDKAVAGERFGMIRFGSRVDVIVPPHSEVKVKIGDKAVAGETVLALME